MFQFQKNSLFHRTIGHSPYNSLLENPPKIGLNPTNCSSNLFQTTKEHIFKIYISGKEN